MKVAVLFSTEDTQLFSNKYMRSIHFQLAGFLDLIYLVIYCKYSHFKTATLAAKSHTPNTHLIGVTVESTEVMLNKLLILTQTVCLMLVSSSSGKLLKIVCLLTMSLSSSHFQVSYHTISIYL